MSGLFTAGTGPADTLRAGVLAAALAVTACFGAAVTFAEQPAQASETSETR